MSEAAAKKKEEVPKAAASAAKVRSSTDESSETTIKQQSVRFAADTKKPTRRGVAAPPQAISRHQHVGKANLKRDLPIFFGVLAFLLFVAFQVGDVGHVPTKEDIASGKAKKPKDLKAMRENLGQMLVAFQHEQEGRRRKTECGLFLAESTIPHAGLSWYAGRTTEPGELVLESGVPLQVDGVDLFDNDFLLKHHPGIINVERAQDGLRATQHIQAGEELFISFEQHPHSKLGDSHSLYSSVPTPNDYKLAEEVFDIEAEAHMLATINRKFGPRIKKTADRSAGGGERLRIIATESLHPNSRLTRSLSPDKSLQAVIRTTAVFNRRVSHIIPAEMRTLTKLLETADAYPYKIVTNRTVYWLEVQAKCMDDVVVRDGAVYAQRPIRKGQVITIAPLHVSERDQECQAEPSSQESQTGSCIGHPQSPVLLCPVSKASFLKFTTAGDETNALFQWGGWNSFNHAARRIDPRDVIAKHPIGLTMDIVATAQIEIGDEIIVDAGKGKFVEYGIELNDRDFPKHWRPKEDTGEPESLLFKPLQD